MSVLSTVLRRLAARSSALLRAVVASAPSATGRVMGRFTLPVAADWGHRRLPAGSYGYVVSTATSRAWVHVRGGHGDSVFFAVSADWAAGAPGGQLCLVYDESGYRVRSLKPRDTRRILYFDAARSEPAPIAADRWPGVLYVPLTDIVPTLHG